MESRPINSKLERLLRAAAEVGGRDEGLTSPPFGFETRVIALWRASGTHSNGLGRLLRRVAMLAVAVISISTVGTIRELAKTRDSIGEPSINEFAIADSAIESEFEP